MFDLPKHQMTMTVLMTPDMANFSGKVHGGALLKELDQVAYAPLCGGVCGNAVGGSGDV
jgi:acyl-CoA hydrolase